MKKRATAGFTLIEIITALAIILVLVGLVVSVAGIANKNSALARARAELKTIEGACEAYKGDNGAFPQDFNGSGGSSSTDTLSPKKDFVPTDKKYADAGLFLYKELSGDHGKGGMADGGNSTASGDPDGVPDQEKRYLREVNDRIFKADRDPNTHKITKVLYLVDPFGYPYGYSTAAAKAEQDFQAELKTKATATRKTGNDNPGFNSGSADIWTTGGSKPQTSPTDDKAKGQEWAKWVKNW